MWIHDPLSFETTGNLLEWAPYVMVHRDALDAVLPWGIKLDAVLAPAGEALGHETALAEQWPLEIVFYPAHEQPWATGMAALLARTQRAVHITTTNARALLDIFLPHAPHLNIILLDATTRWSVAMRRYEKWLPAGTTLQLAGAVPHTRHGLKGDNSVETAGVVTLLGDDVFWVGEPL